MCWDIDLLVSDSVRVNVSGDIDKHELQAARQDEQWDRKRHEPASLELCLAMLLVNPSLAG